MTYLVDMDWLIDDGEGDRPIHALSRYALNEVRERYEEAEWQWITTACGQTMHAGIPGLFTRMGATRCEKCCDALGMPHGIGSPKNDDTCRAILGMDKLDG